MLLSRSGFQQHSTFAPASSPSFVGLKQKAPSPLLLLLANIPNRPEPEASEEEDEEDVWGEGAKC